MSPTPETVVAGGAVCWKVVDNEVRVLLVHRTQHKDVSLPKGKCDPGETVPETAQREILEETGLHITLGAYLGRVDYLLPSKKPKEVHYWAAEVDPGEAERSPFESNDEIFVSYSGPAELHHAMDRVRFTEPRRCSDARVESPRSRLVVSLRTRHLLC